MISRIIGFAKRNTQTILIGVLSFLIMYRPNAWTLHLMDYIVYCWALNSFFNWAKEGIAKW